MLCVSNFVNQNTTSIMKEKHGNKQLLDKQADGKIINDLPGYPSYPEGEDIFNKYREEQDLNPEDISKNKELNGLSGNDLDVPGSELDDEQEEIGSEDEENNYYSLGGDDHNDLDENKG
jgi:hypothetical protein